jgi:hypothetical protein
VQRPVHKEVSVICGGSDGAKDFPPSWPVSSQAYHFQLLFVSTERMEREIRRTLAVPAEAFLCFFPQSLQVNAGIVPQLGHNCFLPNPFQFKYYISGHYPSSCLYLKNAVLFIFQNTTFRRLDSVSVFR